MNDHPGFEMESIRQKVTYELKKMNILNNESITVDFEGQEIILRGDVMSTDDKRLVEDVALSVPEVLHLDNQLRILGEDVSQSPEL